jgi:hypothetical protein
MRTPGHRSPRLCSQRVVRCFVVSHLRGICLWPCVKHLTPSLGLPHRRRDRRDAGSALAASAAAVGALLGSPVRSGSASGEFVTMASSCSDDSSTEGDALANASSARGSDHPRLRTVAQVTSGIAVRMRHDGDSLVDCVGHCEHG